MPCAVAVPAVHQCFSLIVHLGTGKPQSSPFLPPSLPKVPCSQDRVSSCRSQLEGADRSPPSCAAGLEVSLLAKGWPCRVPQALETFPVPSVLARSRQASLWSPRAGNCCVWGFSRSLFKKYYHVRKQLALCLPCFLLVSRGFVYGGLSPKMPGDQNLKVSPLDL